MSGTLALKRFHSGGGTIAPSPVGASGGSATPVNVLGTQPTYDIFGNVTSTKGNNGHCASIALDAQYAQFPVSETIYAGTAQGTGCGDRTFTTLVTLYDRGMETILQARSINNQPSKYDYDGFGRLLKSTGADPANPGQLATYPSSIIEYYLPANPHATPYVITAVRGQDGANVNMSSYVERWSYSDGLGRSLGVLVQADRSAGDLGDFVLTGLADYDSKGQPIRAYENAFYAGAASAFQPTAPANIPLYPASVGPPAVPAGPALKYSRVEYDSFGRKIRSYDRAGTLKVQMVPHPQSTDAWDVADLQAGPASGTYATSISDGHGRAVTSIVRANVNSAIEQHVTSIEYLLRT